MAGEPPQRKRKVDYVQSLYEAPKGCPKIVNDWDDDDDYDVDWTPALEEEYYRQVEESLGFDIGDFPYIPVNCLAPYWAGTGKPPCEMALYARLGLHCFNFQKGTNLQYMHVNKCNFELSSILTYYITVDVKDLANDSLQTFQTCVTQAAPRDTENLRVFSEICRLKPEIPGKGDVNTIWDDDAIDGFYKGPMPNWLADDALAGADHLRFYEVQEADLRENDWLSLFTEFALSYRFRTNMDRMEKALPVKVKKIVVETHDAAVEPRMKLKASNAIFYVSFEANSGRGGESVDYRAVIRKIMDGRPGHIALQLSCWSSSAAP